MKLTAKFISSAVCLTVAAITALSVSADDVSTISYDDSSSASTIYAEQLLDEPLSPGIRVMAYERPLILSGTSGDDIQFSAEVLNDYNGYVPSSVKIISVPDTASGTLIYNSEPVSAGQSVSVLSLSSLYYIPSGTEDTEFTISTDNTNIMRCVIRQKDSPNTAPDVTGNSTVTTHTRLDTAVAGYLGGTDADGDSISYEIISRPTKGIVSIVDPSTGQFVYHPYEGMSGSDKFSYRICDSYGSYSETETVSLNIEYSKSKVYSDTADSYYTAAINDVVSSGIMQTMKDADGEFFNPNEPVSRIDFLIMAMKTMGAGDVEGVSSSSFADDDTLSDTEKGYLSAAYKLGIVSGAINDGKLTFMPDDAITGAAAAVMLNGILGLPEDNSVLASAANETLPTWAAPSVSALTDAGIINKYIAPANSVLTRENVAVILSGLMHEIS